MNDEVDLSRRSVTMTLEVLAELLDANSMIDFGHDHENAEIREEGIERHHAILSGLGLTEREITELDDAAAGAGDAWMPE
jgi:hypothetical protein